MLVLEPIPVYLTPDTLVSVFIGRLVDTVDLR